jgi:hypothetical protein
MQQRIDAFVAAGLQPHTTSTGAVLARQGTRFQTLVDTRGQRTQVGRYYEQASSSNLPAGGFDPSQAPTRSGDTEYIRMRGGEQRATRRWDPAISDYRFTDLGQSYYTNHWAPQGRFAILHTLYASRGAARNRPRDNALEFVGRPEDPAS